LKLILFFVTKKSVFEPPSGDLEVTNALHLYLFEKSVGDFLFIVIRSPDIVVVGLIFYQGFFFFLSFFVL